MQTLTSFPVFPEDQFSTVVGYTEVNEIIRKALIAGEWMAWQHSPLKELITELDINFKNAVMNMVRAKCEDYDGGAWEYNEHGLLTLITGKEEFECDGCFCSYTVTAEELSFAMSSLAANHLTWVEGIPEHALSFFTYMYHYACCLLSDTKKTPTFRPATVYDVTN